MSAAEVNTAVNKILEEYDSETGFEPVFEKFNSVKLNILTDMLSGFAGHDENFDMRRIVRIDVQDVEWSDKSKISWKSRHKAVILGKFVFEKPEV